MDQEDIELERAWLHLTVAGASEGARRIRSEDDDAVDHLIRGVLDRIGAQAVSRELQATHLRALVEGLTLAVCRSSITPEQARDCLDAHVREVPREAEVPVRLAAGESPR